MKNSSSNYETALVDTNIFLKTIDIRHIADTITITPEILAELKDPQVKSFFASCPIPYAVREASKDSLAAVIDAATIVGDVHVLSKADISLIALARDIAIELGDGELLKTPELKDTVRMKRKVDRDRKQRIPPGKDFSPVIREMMLKEKEEERAKIEKETDGWVFAGRKKNKNKKNPNINNNKETVDSETKPTASQDEIKVENEEKPELAKENKEKEEGDKKETTSGQNTDKTECKSNKSSRKGNKKRRARGRNKDFFKINGMDGNWITEETLEKERDMGRKELVIIDDDDDDDDKTKEEKNTSNNDNNNNNNNNNSKPLSRHKSILLTADTPMQNTAVALGLCVVMPKNSFEDVREVVKSRADFIVIKKCRANRICCKACSYVLNPEEVPNVCPACGTEHMFVRVWANINSEGQIYGITQAAIQNAKLIDTQSKKIDWYHRPGLAALSGADWFQQDFAGPTTIRRTARDYKLPKGQQRKTIGLDSSRVIVGERLMATQNDNGK